MKRLLIFIAAFALLAPLSAVRAVTVSPVTFEFDIARGASRQGEIKVWNETEEQQIYSVIARNFVPKGEEGAQEYIEEETPTGLASWVTVDRQSVTLAPGEGTALSFAVRVPFNAEPGGHYAAIFLASGPGEAQGNVGIGSRVGALLLVNVPGEIREEARIESFRLLGGNVLTRLPANFELRVRNLGSAHLRPGGTVIIRNLIGWEVARVPVNPKGSAVLPASVRRVESVWDKTDDPSSLGNFWAETKNEWRNFALGRYTATVDASYGSKNVKFPKETTGFWAFPWHLALFAAAAAIAFLVLMKVRHALKVRAAIRRSSKTAE